MVPDENAEDLIEKLNIDHQNVIDQIDQKRRRNW